MMRPYLPLLTVLLAGCALTRVTPPADLAAAPPQYKESAAMAQASAAVPDEWWTLFGDPVLDELERRLVIGNQNLKASAAAMSSARATYEASRSAFWPTLSLGAGATRSASPAGNSTAANAGAPVNNFSLTASSSWEIDLWGRLSQAADATRSTYQASADELAAARLSAQALLAQTYFSLRTLDAQMQVLERSVAAYQRSYELTQTRYAGGVAARSDVLQAQTQLKTTQAQQADMTAQRAQLEHAIAVLVGTAPSALELGPHPALPNAPVVPEMLPATLLARRPDIAAAQRRVAAAYAQIGVADAAWLPDLSLAASGGYRNSQTGGLIGAPNLLWSLGASLSQLVFDNGQRKLAAEQARASAAQVTANYRQLVLTALQEVEDNLVLAYQLQREATLQAEAQDAARRNLDIVLAQYQGGTVSYLNVVTAQATLLASENSLLAVRNRHLAAVNVLLKNIAGRWTPV